MNTNILWRLGVALGALALSACQSTMLENLPTGTATACPADWRGAWIALDGDSGQHEDTGFVVTGDCTLTLVDEHEGKPRELVFTPRFASARGSQLVLFGHEDAAKMLEQSQAPPKAGWYPFEWRRSGDVLSLRAPEHRRIATLVVNGALDGTVTWSGNDGFVFVAGDAAVIATALGDGRVSFGGDGGARMARIGDGRRELDRALARQKREHERAEAREKRAGSP